MEKIIKRELLIYASLLLVLVLLMHPDILSDPTTRLGMMQQYENYVHPLLYTLFVYLILFVFRAVVGAVLKLFRKKAPEEEL